MGRKVLILNADYSVVSVCTVPKAFLLVYLNKAEMIAEVKKASLRTINKVFPLPSIIKLNSYTNIPYKNVEMSRVNIFKRDNHTCVYCGSKNQLTLDHVMPRSRGGGSSWDNLVAACKKCNTKKGHFTPDEANMKLAHKPFKPSFVHFVRNLSGKLEENWIPYLEKRR